MYLINIFQVEYQCDIPLYDMEQNSIGSLYVMLNLEDHGPYYKVKGITPSKLLILIIYFSFIYLT